MTSTAAWSNWAGNQQATPERVHFPHTTEQIAQIVSSVTERGGRLRPIGSGHSFTGIGLPVGDQLSLREHARALRVDAETGLVTVQAGMTLHDLNHLLERVGLAMNNLGDIDQQSVAGAISTGTHGTGARFGGIATQVRGLKIVTANGAIVDCSADQEPATFAAATVGLGALGVISEVTLQTVPLFAIEAREFSASLDEVLENFEQWADETDHVEFYWFPHTRRCLVKRNTRRRIEEALDPLPGWRAWLDDDFLSNTVFGGVVGVGRRFPRLVRPLAKASAHALGDRSFTDVSHRVFCSPRRVRFIEMEYAIPRGQLLDALTELVRAVEASNWRVAVPVEVRVAAADDLPLSTAQGRESAYVAIHVPPGSPDQSGYFGTWEAIASQYAGRPHWGKMHTLDAARLDGLYPCFGDFLAVRDRLDPKGLFTNPYLEQVLGR